MHLLAVILEAEGRTIIAHAGSSATVTTRLLQGLVLMAVTTPANGQILYQMQMITDQMIEKVVSWGFTTAMAFVTLGIVYAWNNWTVWSGQSLVIFVPFHAADSDSAQEPHSDSEEEPHWRREGFDIDDDGHWIPQNYDDVEESEPEIEGEGLGCYIAPGGCCMHTSCKCGGPSSSWVTFCSTIQDEARAAQYQAWRIDEGWTVTGPLAKKICRTEACCVVCNGGLARLRNTQGVEAPRRKMRWCLRCSGPIPMASNRG